MGREIAHSSGRSMSSIQDGCNPQRSSAQWISHSTRPIGFASCTMDRGIRRPLWHV
jgi:hypothetical protein